MRTSSDILSDNNISPSSEKEIRCLSNNESTLGESKIPFSTSNLSFSLHSDQGTMWEEIKILIISQPVTGHLLFHFSRINCR